MENFESCAADHVQIGHINKAEEFWKVVQMTFFRKRHLSYVQDEGYVSET